MPCATAPRGVSVTVEPYVARPRTGPPPASIFEPLELVVCVSGALVATTLLQEVVKDLYGYFKAHLKDLKKRNPIGDFVIDIEVSCEGEPYEIALRFVDGRSLQIAFFRASRELDEHVKGRGRFELALLGAPKPPGFVRLTSAMTISVVGGGILFLAGDQVTLLQGWPIAILVSMHSRQSADGW